MDTAALILIDLQNDFLAEGGAFPFRHLPTPLLVAAVRGAAEIVRQQGGRLVWVESAYGELAAPVKGETHTGAPCCVRGSFGAAPVTGLEDLAERAEREGLRLVKQRYDAFQETGLEAWLRAAGVERLILAGVATNVCVRATALSARRRGFDTDPPAGGPYQSSHFDVCVLADATTAATLPKHLLTLAELARAGCTVAGWSEIGAAPHGTGAPVELGGLGSGSALHLNRLASAHPAGGGALAALTAEVDWQTMYHRGGEVPRRVATQGEIGAGGSGESGGAVEPLYRHPSDDYPPVRAWTPLVDRVRREAEAVVGHPLNHCLIQLYRDGQDWIGAHSDKTLDVVPGSYIVNVSAGATRAMVLRKKGRAQADGQAGGQAGGERPARELQRIPLPDGSMMQMNLATNREWLHEIRQQGAAGEIGPRVSLTFRHIGSFWSPATQAAWGTGTPHADRAAAEAAAAIRAGWTEEARLAWELAESERLLRLFREENLRADFDQASYRPGFEVIHLRHYQEHSQEHSQEHPPDQARPERDLYSERSS